MITFGEGKYKVFLEKHLLDEDLIYILGGGQCSQKGGVVVCQPSQKPSVIRLGTHYVVLTPIAEAACEKYNKTVVAVGGIHIDDASKEEIKIIVNNCKELVKCI